MDETTIPRPEVDKQVLIEHALPEDAEAMMRLKKVAWLKAYPNDKYGVTIEDIEKKFTEEDIKTGTENWQKGIEGEPHGGRRQSSVARLDKKVVGFVSSGLEDGQWRIAQLYVGPESQGRGIGTELLQTALGWLGPEKDVYLHVLAWNVNAVSLYEKFGFVKTGREFPAEVGARGEKLLPEIEMLRKAVH